LKEEFSAVTSFQKPTSPEHLVQALAEIINAGRTFP
jgi:hypothetical protein